METRKIYVANTKTQQKYTFDTNAATLGELKQVLTQNGVDFSNMSFTEGISRTTLNDDATVLPSNLPYKGNVTNNLVILLTNTTKNIASGMDRKEAYAFIKSHNLQDAVLSTFGKNFTQVSNPNLEGFIQDWQEDNAASVIGTLESQELLEEGFIEKWLQPETTEETSDVEEDVEKATKDFYNAIANLFRAFANMLSKN